MIENMIEKLRRATVEERLKLLQETYQKNRAFFREDPLFQRVDDYLENSVCPYHIDLTESFLKIIHSPTGQLAHPEAGLDLFAEMLGGWSHETWVDLVNIRIPKSSSYPVHYGPIDQLHMSLIKKFPQYATRLAQQSINLKALADGRKFSPPVVFLGLFHGLHVDYYLSKTEVALPMFIEPDVERFEVSCYFLDYRKLKERFGELYLIIGSNLNVDVYRRYFNKNRITSQIWLRILPGYPFDAMPFIIEQLKVSHTEITNIHYPIDLELESAGYGLEAIQRKYPLLTTQPTLSAGSRVVLVAPGPSLDNEIGWLKENRKGFILFAVHSAVRALRSHGIEPDFQFNLDTILEKNVLRECMMSSETPLVSLYNIADHVYSAFDKHILCAEKFKPSCVKILTPLRWANPATANLAMSFACFCQPAEIYLIGFDFGYRSIDKTHVQGSIHTEFNIEGSCERKVPQTVVLPNFEGTGVVRTNLYLTQSCERVEMAIENLLCDTKVFNLSDGAKIQGAEPLRSTDVALSHYSERERDILKILDSVKPAERGVNWQPFEVSGQERLKAVRMAFAQALHLERFEWLEFSRTIDRIINEVCAAGRTEGEEDVRMDMYHRFIRDLLHTWYCCVIMLDGENAEQAYLEGRELICSTLAELHWPEEFDFS